MEQRLAMPHMIQAALEELGNVIVIQGDVYLPALLAGTHQAFITETAQLVRNSGLAQPDDTPPGRPHSSLHRAARQ